MKINEKNLSIFASTPPYDYEGKLNKKGEVNKSFQSRYFVLKGNLLFYFEKKGDKEPLGLIIVEGCTIELSEEDDKYCFEIAFNGNRTYVLSAESQESMEAWMKALTCAGYEYRKLMITELQRQLEEIEGSRNKLSNEVFSSNHNVPRPPPRRQNPFNRPAPALPLQGSNDRAPPTERPLANVDTGNSTSVAVDRYNGKSSKPATGKNHAASSNALVKNLQPAYCEGSTKSEFYFPLQAKEVTSTFYVSPGQNASSNNSFPTNASENTLENQSSTMYSSKFFDWIHEQFQILVMTDIKSYQEKKELQNCPLIEL